ncbi:hypothetical protein DM02DRAFT_25557 [Periconia macrospinosa]|uniref:Uncharacterized protein n=1 Tax=Periconia macrospinosa TaxID=97972 RepID=A0A2V1DL60_9PLEO|nr:hypothetical protein DM02DRAFT_25557 [Periconia macrospinosa]
MKCHLSPKYPHRLQGTRVWQERVGHHCSCRSQIATFATTCANAPCRKDNVPSSALPIVSIDRANVRIRRLSVDTIRNRLHNAVSYDISPASSCFVKLHLENNNKSFITC